MSYREQFAQASRAAEYERQQWDGTSYPSLIWELERVWLDRYLASSPVPAAQMDYLDFACGTGRVLSYLEERMRSARGIEISAAMLDIARQKVRHAELLCADITATPEIEGRYDLITCFRFLLNAEPALRRQAMRGLAARLKDRDSRLLFDNHGNLSSYKALRWPGSVLRRGQPVYESAGNVLSHSDVMSVLHDAGLEVIARHGYGLLSGKAPQLFGYDRVLELERRLAGAAGLERLGVHQLYVCRLTLKQRTRSALRQRS
ncbi:MAG: class I SAM-dependent methyltransferase [Actinomycetota bacterium]|nr:class I SAM-dependent methyltransferase [Euzebyaceae bacterium]MDQ3451658.1 class I SAM-dependent methyltransferase [Actinomycetota bacterium]